ncbi:MAG: ethanolamine ammonia-lyase subunit EutB [Fuerstiella sp.]|nr:ethanolamine ammonia-lyase subunit EutB [Fuerstiella sp.]
MVSRRTFLQGLAGSTILASPETLSRLALAARQSGVSNLVHAPVGTEDVFRYIRRVRGAYDSSLYAGILGAANDFKEGDSAVGVAAADEASRQNARSLLANTRLADIDAHSPHSDDLFRFISVGREEQLRNPLTAQTLGRLKRFLLAADELAIKDVMSGLSSDVISCVVKLMTNQELIQIGQKLFNPLPGSQIGAKGYLGARVQPNSPTDNVDDVRWQVLDGWSYAVGDVLLGTNPVSSDPASVAAIQQTLQDLLTTFEINHLMPHCVLSHIDVQAKVESQRPGSTELWFQSIAGSDDANETFDISIDKMKQYAGMRTGQYGLYFETGQGADFTNGHSHGFDMVMHESRKYGFARALAGHVAAARRADGQTPDPWVHLNDVAGFIGPEVFRTREQLVRCCLEDIVMGKLHGLCIGLDVCSTLHMDISLDDLDWCLDEIMPANPAYLMALPTKIDPMLGYLTTGYQDHVRLREKFGYRVNDEMWAFFQQLGVIDRSGQPTEHFGDPLWVYLQYQRRKGDIRSDQEIQEEGRQQLAEVRGRGLFVAEGHGRNTWDLQPALQDDIQRIYDDAKLSIWAEMPQEFIRTIPRFVKLTTKSADRNDYILHPTTGEQLDEASVTLLRQLRRRQSESIDVQIVVSDGLNALAITEDGHLLPFLNQLRSGLDEAGLSAAGENLVMTSGRVRAGYRVGEILFGGLKARRAILHVIGERPGTGHRTFSVYMTASEGQVWGREGEVDHNITKVVSGVATTALSPVAGADEVVRLLGLMMDRNA